MNTKLRADAKRVLRTELKSWKKNKLEEKKLAKAYDEVDKHMLNTRKTHLFEKDLLNKDISENISKTTPTTDEYLNRSYNRYAGWRAREKERLDRRYKGLYKTYMREFSDLGIDNETLQKARKKHAKDQERKTKEKEEGSRKAETNENGKAEVNSADEDDQDNETTADDDEQEEDKDIHTALLDFQKLQLGSRRRYSVAITSSQYMPWPDEKIRRKSADSPLPLGVIENLRRSSLPLFNEDVDEAEKDLVNARSSTPVESTSEAKIEKSDKGRRGRRASLAVTSDLEHSKEMQDIVNKGRRGRRVSIAVPSELDSSRDIPVDFPSRKGRRSSITGFSEDGTPRMGVRLSRRSSLPNIEIPLAYGN